MTDASTIPAIVSFRDIIGLWPSPEAMADDIGANVPAVRKWGQRDRIPSEWWNSILGSDTAITAGVTAELLVRLAAKASTSAEKTPAFAEAR